MVKKSSSPAPAGNIYSHSSFTLFKQPGVTASFALALLCLVLSAANVSAQTRDRSTNVKSDERSRRVDNNQPANTNLTTQSNYTPQAERPPLVRKTAMTYPSRTASQNGERPTLTNDFVIISEASPAAIARSNAALRTTGSMAANIPSIWPVVGPLRSGVGVRSNPFGGSSLEFHKGQDISAPMGTPISATADGVVVIARWMRGYGNGIYIDHGNGITTRYGHLSRIDVVEGQLIKRGDHLGLVGSTGRSTGPHLHYEVRINGQPVSPTAYLPALPAAPTVERSSQH